MNGLNNTNLKNTRTEQWSYFVCAFSVVGIIAGVAFRPIMIGISAFILLYLCFASIENQFLLYFAILPFANIFKFSRASSSIFSYLSFIIIVVFFLRNRRINSKFLISWMVYCSVLVLGCHMDFHVLFKQALIPLLLYVFFTGCEKTIDRTKLYLIFCWSIIAASFAALLRNTIPNMSQYIGLKIAYELKDVKRFCGLYTDPNYYVLTMILALMIMITLFTRKKIKISMYVYYGLVAYFGSITISKSFILTFALASVLFVVMLFRSGKKKTAIFLVILLAVGVFFVLNGRITIFNNIFDRFTASNGDLTTNRTYIWKKYLTYIFENPMHILFGAGIGAGYLGAAPHNTYIDLFYYFGITGTVIFLISCFAAVKRSVGSARRSIINYAPLICTGILFFALSSLKFFDFSGIILVNLILLRDTDSGHYSNKAER